MSLSFLEKIALLALLAKQMDGKKDRTENEKPDLKPGDYLKCETVEDPDVDYTVGKTYKINSYANDTKTAYVVKDDDDTPWHATIKDGDKIVVQASDVLATFSKVKKSGVVHPTENVLNRTAIELKEGDYVECEEPGWGEAKERLTKGKRYQIEGSRMDNPYFTGDDGQRVFLSDKRLNAGEIVALYSGEKDATFKKAYEPVQLEEGDSLTLKRIDGDASWIDHLTIGKKYPIKEIDHEGDAIVENDIGNYTCCAGHTLENGEIKAGFGLAAAIFEKVDAHNEDEDEPLMDRLLKLGPHRAWLDDVSEDFARVDEFEQVVTGKKANGWYVTEGGSAWRYAVPVNAQGEEVTRIEDADPVKPEKPIDRLLKDGPHYAFVSDESEERAAKRKTPSLITGKDDTNWYEDANGTPWRYAVAVDARGNIIKE